MDRHWERLQAERLALVVKWISKRDAEFAEQMRALVKSYERCWLYPACKNRGGCKEHPRGGDR